MALSWRCVIGGNNTSAALDEVQEALVYWEKALTIDRDKLSTHPEREFVEKFAAAVLERGKKLLQPLALPPGHH
jgi:hypothetical protein